MIKIITGNIHDFKTTKAYQLYKSTHLGDGFISLKTMENGRVKYYEALHLSSEEKRILCYHNEHHLQELSRFQSIGPYRFDLDTLFWVESSIEKMIQKRIEPIYLDEIGMLEIQGLGFHSILTKMIQSKLDLILVIRKDLVEKVIEKYDIKTVMTIE
jgi:nucleoside-triphosphatase THEP1